MVDLSKLITAASGAQTDNSDYTNLLSKLAAGSNPTAAMGQSLNAANVKDVQAERWNDISSGFQDGGLTPLTALLKGVTSQVGASKKEAAQMERDAKRAAWEGQVQEYQANEQVRRKEIENMAAAEQQAKATGRQFSQAVSAYKLGDQTPLRNYLASNGAINAMFKDQLGGANPESFNIFQSNGIEMIAPYGRDAEGNVVTGDAVPLDSMLQAYDPEAYAARYEQGASQAALAAEQKQMQQKAQQETMGSIPSGYQLTAEGTLAPIQGGPADPNTAKPSKPIPANVRKVRDEYVSAIDSVQNVNADMAAIVNQIDSGTLDFGPIRNKQNELRNATGLSSEQSRNFASFNSTLERLRNESLRLNAGVQTDGDAQRAWNELLTNINDEKLVKERLQEIQRINQRGAALKEALVESIQNDYGQGAAPTSALSGTAAIGNDLQLPDASAIQQELQRRGLR